MATVRNDIESKLSNARKDESGNTDFMVSKDVYFSPEVARLEKELMWPTIWQVVGRLEEIPAVGSFITYENLDESIFVVRTAADKIQSFHNVCQHRGRRLMDGRGRTSQVTCRFHGWRYNLDGSIHTVVDRHDWDGCEHMKDADLALRPVRVDTWQGWIFVNLDGKAKPLAEFMAPIPERVDPYEISTWRYRWHKCVIVKCNWKVGLEAFNEFYHLPGTHAQLQRWQDDISRCEIHGDHSMMSYPSELNRMWGAPSKRSGLPYPTDIRKSLVEAMREFETTFKAIWSQRAMMATHRVVTELPPDTPHDVALGKMIQFWREAAIAEGAGWPSITPEQMAKAGYDWHMFPNFIFLTGLDGGIFYRIRPNGDDVDSCVFDVWSLARYVPGGEPAIEHEVYDRWQDCDSLGLILTQDFMNMEQVHRGMKSSGFSAARTNPLQETPMVNFHNALHRYLGLGRPEPVGAKAKTA